ncbi:MAG TPA: tetratricopeptide repeat protein [Bacteroidota bacterium]|nr:tetratricopeptide repeat protein [Bacteroidota bacterium]
MAHINSRYRILRALSENPDGGVFLAEDTLFGNSRIALKTIQSTDVDDQRLHALRDEFFTLSRFKHPNIAQVFDFGTINTTDLPGYEGNFFFTLEYIEGSNLFQYTETADTECLSELIFQIAHALAYIHRHGLIHFDIKPLNIIVTNAVWGDEPVPLVKIIDFGFASSMVANIDQPIRGTLDYIAPEILRGDTVDERIDLYSLGATLYEIIARVTPFSDYDATSVIKHHLSTRAPRTEERRPELPAHMHELVARLLEKDPAKRPLSARSIVDQLKGTFKRDALFHSVLLTIPFHRLVGREQESARLIRFLAEGLADKQPATGVPACFVTGETGIGKTSLLHEVRRRVQAGGMLVFDTQCYSRNAQAYEPFMKILRDQLAHARSFGQPGEEFIARHREFLSAVDDEAPGRQADRIVAHTEDPEQRMHFVDMWANLLFDFASRWPYAVLVDNIDNADESTIELFQYVLRSAHEHRVRFIVAGISDAKLSSLLNAPSGPHPESMKLPQLDEAAVHELLRVSLDVDDIPCGLSSAVAQRIGGSPYILREFLSQYADAPSTGIAAVIEQDLIAPTGNFVFTISRLYRQKLALRKPEELFIIRLMSCFDAPVPLKLLEKLAPFSPWRLKNFLDLLINLGFMRPLENGQRYYLSQSQFQSYIYAELGEEKSMLHDMIAETMVREGEASSSNAEAVANHFKHACDNANAYSYFLAAAEYKRAHYALHESITLLNEACALVPSESIDLSVFEQLAQAYSQAGDYKTAVSLYEQLRMEAADNSKQYRYAKELGLIHNREGRLDEAVECLSEAAQRAGTPEETIDVEEELAIIEMSRGRYTEAYERCMRVLEENMREINPVAITGILNNLGIIHFYQNHFEDSAACFIRSIAILQQAGEKSKLIGPYLNIGNVHSAQGQFAEAAQHWRHALLLAQEVGNLQQEARAYNNIGIAAFNQGDHAGASAHYEKAYGIFSRLGFLPGMALCLTNIGEVNLANGDYEQALECWERDLQLYVSLQDEHGMTEIDLQLAGINLLFGNTDEAGRLLADAETLLGTNGITAQHALYHYVKGCLEFACDTYQAAKEHLEKACALFGEAKDHRSHCLASLKLAETEDALHNSETAAALLVETAAKSATHRYPLIQGEALFLLADLSARSDAPDAKPPILLYLEAFEIIHTQLVSEITWQICHKLGTEYLTRGLAEKGRTYLMFAQEALEYLGKKITSETRRQMYFSSCSRGAVLREIKHSLAAMCNEM